MAKLRIKWKSMTYVQSFSEVLYLCPENCLRNRSMHLQFISVQRILPGPHVKWLSLLQLFGDRIGANGRGAHTEETPRTQRALSGSDMIYLPTIYSILTPRPPRPLWALGFGCLLLTCVAKNLKPVFSKSIYEKQVFCFHYLFSFFFFIRLISNINSITVLSSLPFVIP